VLAFGFGSLVLGSRVFDLAFFQTTGLMRDELLAAVPLFVFMGYLVEQAGLMERLFLALRLLLAPVRGSLFIVVILTATVFAMATGIVGAAVPVLGLMAAPMMLRAGYDAKLAAGAITAGGTLGILIPPSVMLLVLGPVLGVSVADLYAAAIVPGFLLAAMYLAYVMIRCQLNPSLGPPLARELRVGSMASILRDVLIGVVPLAILVASTLGAILAGIATPTEAAGVGAFGALALAFAYGRLNRETLRSALLSTLATSSMILFLAVASNVFGAVFARLGGAAWITAWLLGLSLPPMLMMVLIVALVFLLGWPFEWPAIVLVFVPIFYPVVAGLGIDLVWFGALVAVTLQTAFLSPPVAMSGYYLKQVVPDWPLATIFRGMLEFMGIQIVAIALLLAFPVIATWLPERLNRPPPGLDLYEEPAPDEAGTYQANRRGGSTGEDGHAGQRHRAQQDVEEVELHHGEQQQRHQHPALGDLPALHAGQVLAFGHLELLDIELQVGPGTHVLDRPHVLAARQADQVADHLQRHLGMREEESLEIVPRDHRHLGGLHRPHRRRARLVVEHHFADVLPRAPDVDHQLLAAAVVKIDLHLAVQNEEQRVGGLALADERLLGGELAHLDALGELAQRHVGQALEQRDPGKIDRHAPPV
jgi:tripartite ATP-independent transporter DctM subunit